MKGCVAGGIDAVHSKFNLAATWMPGVDRRNWRMQGVPEDLAQNQANAEAFLGKRGVRQLATCPGPTAGDRSGRPGEVDGDNGPVEVINRAS